MPHAYGIELAQTIASMATTLILLWALFDAAKDAAGLRAAGQNGPRGAIAIGNVLRGIFRVVMALHFDLGGVLSILLPPPPPVPDGELQIAMLGSRIILLSATGVLLVDAFVERHYRRKFVRALNMKPTPPPNGTEDRRARSNSEQEIH